MWTSQRSPLSSWVRSSETWAEGVRQPRDNGQWSIGAGCFNQMWWPPWLLIKRPFCSSSSWHTLPPPSFIFFLEMYKVRVNSGNRWWTGGLACCGPWGHRVGQNWATGLNWTELKSESILPQMPHHHPRLQRVLNNSVCLSQTYGYAYDNTHIYLLFCCIALFYFVQWDQCTYCSMPFYLLKNVQHTDCSINKYSLTRGCLSPFRAFNLYKRKGQRQFHTPWLPTGPISGTMSSLNVPADLPVLVSPTLPACLFIPFRSLWLFKYQIQK